MELSIDNIKILGLFDTGTDKSIIAQKDWPSAWTIQTSSQTLRIWADNEGYSGLIQPYVLELPVSLWGRDLLKGMGFKLSNDYSPISAKLMYDMGYHPSFGLGKHLQGRRDPIKPEQ